MVTLVPSFFDRATGAGDFGQMLRDDAYARALFIYNDNVRQSTAFLDQVENGEAPTECAAGGGNAAIRPAQRQTPPRALGIPTGYSAGHDFASLAEGRPFVDRALAQVERLLATGDYDRVVYSQASATDTRRLGSGIFAPPPALLRYAVTELVRLVAEANGG